uniref:Uncharacterized protein n=1 Tax=Lutzomyia longipalpis TaxID=7200 RepID=A0A1B0CEU2_LUTLO
MLEPNSIRTEHKDVIHDVVYDYYGQRMATCSSDQTVKVWDQNEQGVWSVTASWKAHSGSVWRLSWAHPEFGQVLATCSFDRTASVWEETIGEKSSPTMAPVKRWVRRTNLVDSRTSVTDVKFAPKSQGLLLATCSADGVIRIYEAPDIMNLSQWTLQHEIACKLPLSCLSWNQSIAPAVNDHYCTVWRVTWNITGTMLATTGDDGCIRMWKMNYMKNWRCAGSLKSESERNADCETPPLLSVTNGAISQTKYYKKGTITHPSQVPWH